MKLRRISTTENQRPDRSEKRLSGIFQKNYQKKLSKKNFQKILFLKIAFQTRKNPAEAGFFLVLQPFITYSAVFFSLTQRFRSTRPSIPGTCPSLVYCHQTK